MKLLGHVFVATRAFPHNNKILLSFGSLVPETVFYSKDPALSFDQIHEGGFDLYKFCKKYYIKYTDFAIGVMTHSVKYGVDSFNSIESMRSLGFEERDIPNIAYALNIDDNTAFARVHNLYDLALDYYLNKKYPNLKDLVNKTKSMDKDVFSNILAECFKEQKINIKYNLEHLWEKYDLNLLDSFDGLAMFWKSLASNLKEKDPVNIKLTSVLLKSIYGKVQNEADTFLTHVINHTSENVHNAINQI